MMCRRIDFVVSQTKFALDPSFFLTAGIFAYDDGGVLLLGLGPARGNYDSARSPRPRGTLLDKLDMLRLQCLALSVAILHGALSQRSYTTDSGDASSSKRTAGDTTRGLSRED